MRKKRAAALWLAMMLAVVWIGVWGCGTEKEPADKITDLEFQVVLEKDVPKELQELIQQKQANAFKLSYSADGKLYIVVGFGEKDTGGYSVRVNELYLTENAIVMDTDLLGPVQGETVSDKPSYPYVVIVTEDRTESVVFR